MENNIWQIVLENYQGEYITYYFKNYEIAKKNFDRLRDLYKDKPEFATNYSETIMSWYDCQYNEDTTFVYLIQSDPKIYNKIIF